MKPATLQRLIQYLLVALVAIMPFHAFLTISAGHFFGHQGYWQSWKELAVVVLTIATSWLVWRKPELRSKLNSRVIIIAAAFTVWAILISLVHGIIWHSSFWFGLKTDLEFVIVGIVAYLVSTAKLKTRLAKTLLITTATLISIVLVEILILPKNWLTHFGYSSANIVPIQHIAGSTAERYFATLGGPNQLGAYLILPISLIISLLFTKRRWWLWPLLGGSLLSLWLSYSRSALIGVVAAIFVIVFCKLKTSKQRRLLLASAVVIFIIGAVGSLKLDNRLHDLISHGPGQSVLSHSDSQRLDSLKNGIKVAAHHPLGEGLGTAGPASFHNAHTIITEDYYLQIAIETGVIGLLLFIALEITIGLELFRRADTLSIALLATLIGVSVVNFFLHGLADSTLAIVFGVLTGTTLGAKQHKQAIKQPT